MDTITLQLKFGQMTIDVEESSDGWYRRVAKYNVTLSSGKAKTLTNHSKYYKTSAGAAKEAKKFADMQEVLK